VDDVEVGQRGEPPIEGDAVLAVEGVRQRPHGYLPVVRLVVARRVDDVHVVAPVLQSVPPRADRVRDAVDTGKVAVGEESDVHTRVRRLRVVGRRPV